ncbi:MAG: thioredoxin family protein [Bacteroidales bacterium]|nr:thioredoxin family protein [Bacteroidales bacterium]
MMRLPLFIAASVTAAITATGHPSDGTAVSMEYMEAPQDSTAMARLDAKLKEYLASLDFEPLKIKCEEADFIISACSDSAIRQKTAETVYRHFLDSKVMGDEAVAIHIYDNWYADGKVTMSDEAGLWEARLFATVNRQSLIGCRAPGLQLEDIDGNQVEIFRHDVQPDGRYTILYFYDTECPKCRIESILLRNVLENDNLPVNLYAIYTGQDRDKWQSYVTEQLSIDAPETETLHLWCPGAESGMETSYGIIQTPRMFLVRPDGIIAGRGLDTYALEQLLTDILAPREIEYGSDEAMEMFRTAFSSIEKGMGCEGVSMMADHISDSVLEHQDTLLYKQMIGDLLYFVSSQRGENYKCGTPAFADKYILERSDIWKTSEDSLKVVSLAVLMKNIAELAPAGQKMPDIKVPASVITCKSRARTGNAGSQSAQKTAAGMKLKTEYGTYNLGSLKNATVIFHTEGCNICKAEISAAYRSLESGETGKVVLIDMDEMFSSKPDLAEQLLDSFDLSALPFILTTDSRARIARKYISLQ